MKRQKVNDGEGIFSKLHESLITRILSSLPTKDAVRTSVLSKNWRCRWTYITKLDLNDSVLYSRKRMTGTKQCFVNFVNKALILTYPTIESFSLVLANECNKYDASIVNTWISSVLNRGVKIVHIQSPLELSFSAFTCHFLFNLSGVEELMLEMPRCTIGVPPTSIYFGSLKFFKLTEITFTPCSYSENRELCFPVLKKLEIINCTWLIAKSITLKAPLLERVLIVNDTDGLFREKRATKIYFCASPLKEFTYHSRGYISPDIVLLDSSIAHNASVDIFLYNWKNIDADKRNRAVLLLKQFNQMQYLKFDGWGVLPKARGVVVLPLFDMLSHLELGFITCKVLLGFLLKSRVLKTLVLQGLSNFDQELLNSAIVPDCFLSTLQVVKFASVKGNEHELCLAKFVMTNCLVLKRMSINILSWNLKAVVDFKENIFSFKKDSKILANVEFSHVTQAL